MTTSNAVTVESAGLAADSIASSPASYYGATVNYTVADSTYQSTLASNSITWKIFYAGSDYSTTGSHIYLIASDYVPRTCLPASSAGHSLNDAGYICNNTAYFDNILRDYPNGSASVSSSELKKLNNSYFSQNYSSSDNNWRSVAYMMDTSSNVWGKYANSDYADYAIGGPTIEMLMTSYGQKYNMTSYQAKATSRTGYLIYCPNAKKWEEYMSNSKDYLSTSDTTYVINQTTNAGAMYIASGSPYGDSADYVQKVGYNGYVSPSWQDTSFCGFRPLVCLSSDVKLVDAGNGTYNLSN